MTETLEVEQFIDELHREIADKKLSLLDAEFLDAIEHRRISREQIGEWAKAFYAATRNGRVTLGNFYANSPDEPELRRELAANIFEEETGRLSGVNKCHMEVFYDLLAAFEVTPDEADELESPLGNHQVQGRPIPIEDFFVELTAYGFSVETPNAEFCARVFSALKDNYGFTDEQLTWFSMHAELDADHGDEFRKYAARAAEYPGGLDRVRSQTLSLCAATNLVWNGAGRWH